MRVIAKTDGGVLIEATDREVKEIMGAVTGVKPNDINVGQKIPAIDYASTITKIKSLSENNYFRNLIDYASEFNSHVEKLKEVVDSANSIET